MQIFKKKRNMMIEIKLIAEDKKETYSVKFDYIDITLEDIYFALEGLLVSYGFSPETIKQYYFEKAELLNTEKNIED